MSAIHYISHVTRMNDSCQMYKSHGTHMNESWHTYKLMWQCKWGATCGVDKRHNVTHLYVRHEAGVDKRHMACLMSHVTCINEPCHTYEWVMSHIWMSHVTHMTTSCDTYEWVMSHIWMRHVAHMNESCHTYGWAMSHIWMSHVTQCKWGRSL